MEQNVNPIPFISRLFVGPRNEFETELVFGEKGCVSPREEHPFDELVVLVEGRIQVTYERLDEPEYYEGHALIEIPAGTMHQISLLAEQSKMVIIHADRSGVAATE